MKYAAVAHPVERHLAKVEVASSSLVSRSTNKKDFLWKSFLLLTPGDCIFGSPWIFFAVNALLIS